MSTHIKLSKAQISKVTQSGRFLPNMLENLGKKVIASLESLEDLGVLIDRVTETVKHEIKTKKMNFLELC